MCWELAGGGGSVGTVRCVLLVPSGLAVTTRPPLSLLVPGSHSVSWTVSISEVPLGSTLVGRSVLVTLSGSVAVC